ncbi:unnamed protein product [Adineta steineri]|uniref:Uncharacterized protein n=1 Tax=Adineta steineri TaxID=433720 RepID=A0A819DWC0_9BILA|nr:unnamed protein product [Adineta steineri]
MPSDDSRNSSLVNLTKEGLIQEEEEPMIPPPSTSVFSPSVIICLILIIVVDAVSAVAICYMFKLVKRNENDDPNYHFLRRNSEFLFNK